MRYNESSYIGAFFFLVWRLSQLQQYRPIFSSTMTPAVSLLADYPSVKLTS